MGLFFYAKKYAEWQAHNRQYNDEMLEFEAMQRLYKQRGETPPYTDIGAFRRAYRSEKGSLPYAKSHYIRRDAKQYDRLNAIDPTILPQSLDKAQALKYNNEKKFLCPLMDGKQIHEDSCYDICMTTEGLILPTGLPDVILSKKDYKEICLKCPHHQMD